MKKEIKKTIRFNKSEINKIKIETETLAVNFSDFARSAILNHQIKLPINKEFLYELNRIGNNLNQIAKAVNTNNKIDILKHLIKIEKELKRLEKSDS